MSMAKRWTTTEDEQLIKLYPDHTYEELGTILNRTRSSIAKRVTVLELATKKNSWSSEDVNRLKELHGQGLTQKEIADELGHNVRGVAYQLRKQGLSKVTGHRYILQKASLDNAHHLTRNKRVEGVI